MINTNLIQEDFQQTIEDLFPHLKDKQYKFNIVPEKIVEMNNGIEYYYVEIECDDGKFMINAYGREADKLFTAVHQQLE